MYVHVLIYIFRQRLRGRSLTQVASGHRRSTVYMYVSMYRCICIYVYVHVYIYIYIHIHKHWMTRSLRNQAKRC